MHFLQSLSLTVRMLLVATLRFLQSLPPVVRTLFITNMGIFLADHILNLQLIPAMGLYHIETSHFHLYQLCTYFFIHGGLTHLLSNMLVLLNLGPILENRLGSKRMLELYLAAAIGAALIYAVAYYINTRPLLHVYASFMQNPTPELMHAYIDKLPQDIFAQHHSFLQRFFMAPNDLALIVQAKAKIHHMHTEQLGTSMVGASGATFGLLTAFAMCYPHAALVLLFFPVPIPARYFIVLYGAYEFYSTLQANPGDHIAHTAHLGGIVAAYIFMRFFYRNPWRYYS